MNFSREILYHRHRLSHQQIDQLLGEQKSGEYLAEKLVQMEQLREFFRITDALKEAGIEFICLKGPWLSQRIYGEPTFRQYNDFDLLIHQRDLDAVISTMKAFGYYTPDLTIPEDPCRKKFTFSQMNEIMFHHPEESLGVEIHWRLLGGRNIDPAMREQLVWGNSMELKLSGRSFRILSTELDLLYVCIHGGLHAYRRLKWLVDVKDFLQKVDFDKGEFLRLAQQFRAFRLLTLTNGLIDRYFPDSRRLPVQGMASLPQIRFCIKEIEKDEETKSIWLSFRRFRFALGVFPGLKYKLSVIKNNLLATDSINSKYIPCIPLLYYLIGPFWKLFRGFR